MGQHIESISGKVLPPLKSERKNPPMSKRRELLKGIAVAGATTGAVWKKPVVDTVMLPVHAETSETSEQKLAGSSSNRSSSGQGDNWNNSEYIVKMLSLVSDNAHAILPSISRFYLCATPKDNGSNVDVELRYEVGDSEDCLSTEDYSGVSIPVDNASHDLIFVKEECIQCSEEHTFQILFKSVENGAQGEISDNDNGVWSFNIPFGTCSFPAASCCEVDSDSRLKTDIQSLGETSSGISIYRYKYLKDQTQTDYVGVMAQDLIETHPQALVIGEDGYYKVKYGELGMRMAKYEEYEEYGMEAINLAH